MSTEADTEKFSVAPLFVGLAQPEILKLLKISENVATNPGDQVVREGDQGDGVYVIAAGVYEVVKSDEKKVLARLEGGAFFGEMSLVRDEPRAASVVCVEAGRLKKISADKFNQLLAADDLTVYKVVLNMSRMLADRLARVEARLVS